MHSSVVSTEQIKYVGTSGLCVTDVPIVTQMFSIGTVFR
jgi:hypothetical protein